VTCDFVRLSRAQRSYVLARSVFVAAAVIPFVVPWLERWPSSVTVASALRAIYGLQCHQRVSRGFVVWGAALPVCARCLGIYAGLGLAALIGRPRLRPDPFKAWFLIGGLLLLVDVATEWVRLRPPAAWLRAATGAFLSYGIGLAILLALRPQRFGRH